MVSAKNVQDLNARIEKIHTEKTKVETQRDMLKKRLKSELEAYKNQFGVSLMGKNLAETKELISTEAELVTKQVLKEYELKEKVVSAIERGDYDTAYELLGIKTEVKEEVKSNGNLVHSKPTNSLEGKTAQNENDSEEPELSSGAVENKELELEDDFDDLLMEDSNSNDSMSMEVEEEDGLEEEEDDLEVDDDEDDMDLFKNYAPSSKSSVGMQGVEDTFGSMDEMVMEDTPDLDDDDFGFGDMLQGSKFSVE